MKLHARIEPAFWSLLYAKYALWREDAREQFYREVTR